MQMQMQIHKESQTQFKETYKGKYKNSRQLNEEDWLQNKKLYLEL
jgi:hypothetical protein